MNSRRLVPVLLVLALGTGGCGFFGEGADARDEAEKLVTGLESGKLAKVAFTEKGVQTSYDTQRKPLAGFDTKVELDQVTRSGDKASARLAWTQDIGGHEWKHTTKATLVKKGDAWQVNWKPSILADGLGDGDTLRVTRIKPERGEILGANDQPIVVPRPVIRFGIDKAQTPTGTAPDAARRLAALLDLDPTPYLKAVTKAGPKAFVQAIVLRRPQVSSGLLAQVAAIKGARAISDHLPLAPTKEFAAALIGTVGPVTAELVKKSDGRLRAGDDAGLSGLQLRYDEQLFGTPGVKISAVPSEKDQEATTLFEADAKPGDDLHLSLDPALQTKAEQLLSNVGPASAVVAIKPSTGEVLAAASGPGSKGYNTATFGRYAPGSTFKVISALALLRSGLKPTATVPCTPSLTVNGKVFKNYDDYPSNRLGRISLTDALANSCNTAFISQRGRIRGNALAEAAEALGVGKDYDVGYPSYFGQVPPPASETERAADMIGQGKVLASPLSMAAVAASVVKGTTVVPTLVADAAKPNPAPAKPLTAAEARQLRALMHAVVSSGSGAALASLQPPEVLAKTGTAEYGTGNPLPTHTWMLGAQGDLAVAVFVATGQSGSQTSGPILKAFLEAAQ